MARARTKQDLLVFAPDEYDRLMSQVAQFTPDQQTNLTVFDNRTVKDVLAHLYDWQRLLVGWINAGEVGEPVSVPAPGYTFAQTPALNETLFQASRDKPLADVLQDLESSHNEMMEKIANYPVEVLETPKRLQWTRSSTLASYFASATSSHYVWASGLLRKRLRSVDSLMRSE